MNTHDEQLARLLERVASGDLLDCTPEQIDELEALLNRDPAAADRLADVRPTGTRPEPLPTPDEPTWDAMFARIEQAVAGGRPAGDRSGGDVDAGSGGARPTVLGSGLWRTLGVAAAALVLAVIWRLGPRTHQSPNTWDLRLASDVSVEDVEVYDDATSFVAFSDDGSQVIWVIDNQSNQDSGV